MDSSGRLHSFDNLRAIMMWLGIILHVALNHTTGPSPLPWRDAQTTPVADLILVFIHAFRMPVFFILAGYFVALLAAQRGYKAMLRHRLRRLALPFVIFWPILFVCTGLLILVALHVAAYGTAGIDLTLFRKKSTPASPFNTMHMWFLYYLMWFSLLAAVAGPMLDRIPATVRLRIDTAFRAMASRWWGPILLTIPLAIVGSFYRAGILTPTGSFIPNPAELIHHGLFFAFGMLMYRHQDSLFPVYTKQGWAYLAAGFAMFVLTLGAFKTFSTAPHGIPHIEAWIAITYNLTSWLWSLALVGLFLRFMGTQNRVLRYISDSSYWVFLVHMLGTIGFGAMLYNMPVGPVTKMALNILATTAACLLTYQLLVRYTIVGVLLNGRRHPAGKRLATAAPG